MRETFRISKNGIQGLKMNLIYSSMFVFNHCKGYNNNRNGTRQIRFLAHQKSDF